MPPTHPLSSHRLSALVQKAQQRDVSPADVEALVNEIKLLRWKVKGLELILKKIEDTVSLARSL